jgi:hypothetical protein
MRLLRTVVLALIVTVTGSEAQTDLAKLLVGKWEGEVEVVGSSDPNRTLIIESVITGW